MDRLVQLLETPVFTPLRLQLLHPAHHPALLRRTPVPVHSSGRGDAGAGPCWLMPTLAWHDSVTARDATCLVRSPACWEPFVEAGRCIAFRAETFLEATLHGACSGQGCLYGVHMQTLRAGFVVRSELRAKTCLASPRAGACTRC